MNKNDSSGFGVVEVIIIVVVLIAIGFSAWTVLKPKNKTNSSSSSANSVDTNNQNISANNINGVALGIDTPTNNDSNAIKEIGRTPAIIDDFIGWKTSGQYTSLPVSFINYVISLKSTPMITWQPTQDITGDKTSSVLASITNGQQDAYIKSWVDAAKKINHTIYIRLMHEMNGAWYPWGYSVNGNTPGMYVAAFRHVVSIFQQDQANNVQFVWCVATSTANGSSNKVSSDITSYFPGDDYIAWTAMDGYNRKDSTPKSFAQIFSSTYSTLTSISKRPVMIPETATVEDPSNPSAKADWIKTAFLTTLPNQFPKVKGVLYFDSKGHGYSYQIDTSPQTLAAIKDVFTNSYYQAQAPNSVLSF